MKLLILTPGFYPDTRGGIGKHVYYLSRELRRLGNQVIIVTRRCRPDHPTYEEVADGISCYRVSHANRFGRSHPLDPLVSALQSVRWQRKIQKKHPNIEVVLTLNPWWILFSHPRRLWPDARLVYLFHYDPYTEIVSNRGDNWKTRTVGHFFNFITAHCMKQSDQIQVLSDHTKEIALSMIGQSFEKKIIKVPGAVDTSLYHSATLGEKESLKKQLKIPLGPQFIITVRGLKRRTGVDKLIGAAHLLKRNGHDFFLLIIGDGYEKPDLEKQIHQHDLGEQVKIIGNLSEEELASYYRAADLFIMPSQAAEGFGTSTIEALACGLITLGTNNGATPEILNLYQKEWVIDGCTAVDIYKKMSHYLSHPEKFAMPPDQIKKITENHFSWSVVAQQFLEKIR